MTYGLFLNNSVGKRTLGVDTSVPRFVGKFQSTSWSVNNRTGKRLIFSVTCPKTPLCFLSVPAGRAAKVSRISGTAPYWTVEVLCPYSTGQLPQDIEMYVFSTGYTSTSAGSYGMSIKRSNGEVAFDTGFKHLVLEGGYGFPRGSVIDSSTIETGISKPAYFFNAFGQQLLSLFTISRFLYVFGTWLPVEFNLHVYHMDDAFSRSNNGQIVISPFLVNDIATVSNQPNYQVISGAAVLVNINDYVDPSLYTWGAYSPDSIPYTSPCVGDPYCQVASCLPANFAVNFFPNGINTGIVPASGVYTVLQIDGALYD